MDDRLMEEYLEHGGDLSPLRWLKSRRLLNPYSIRRLAKALQEAESEGTVRRFKVTKPFVDGRTDVWWAWERTEA